MRQVFILSLVFSIILFACTQKQNPNSGNFDFDTQSDSARYYFLLGWKHILDYGQWTLSEEAFRKAMEYDQNFTIGKSLVGRISDDLEERQKILHELLQARNHMSPDGLLLLECYILSVEFMNMRAQGFPISDEKRQQKSKLSEENHRIFIRKYPNNDYEKAEYIEMLHANYGPQTAIDSLRILATPSQRLLPFFVGYEATLQAELKNFEEAFHLTQQLDNLIDNPKVPAPYFIRASIYMEMDSIERAKFYLDKTIELDPKHLIAQGMRKAME